jgi:hypothetical protein
MKLDGISFEYESEAELVDLLEELRTLYETADEGLIDLSPVLRSLLANAYFAAEARLVDAAAL